jgi:hypothetical protein
VLLSGVHQLREERHYQCQQQVPKKSAVFFSVTWPKAVLKRCSAFRIRRIC